MKKIAQLLELIEASKCKKKKKNEEITLADLKDLIDDLKKQGYDDEEKLKGMLNKAKEIAKKQGKENDKETVVGIFQGFFQEK